MMDVEREKETSKRGNLRETRDVSVSFCNGRDRAERVDGPAMSERRRLARRRRQEGGGCCCKVGARLAVKRQTAGGARRAGFEQRIGGEQERAAALVRGKRRERRIRYLSRRCCVQVNKLTRRRASAIFFPIKLNLLLTLFPCSLAPSRPSSSLFRQTLPFVRSLLSIVSAGSLAARFPFPVPIYRSLCVFVFGIDVPAVVFLLNLSLFLWPFVLSLSLSCNLSRVSAVFAK